MKKIIKVIIILAILFVGIFFIQSINFNGMKLAHYYNDKTKISRDNKERYNKEWSYKIESSDYNDFMIYQTLDVQPNTAYKVSCMVKTKDIQPEKLGQSGFNICLKDNLEKSESLMGTNDWTYLEFYFDSNNNEKIDIAFRLGDNNLNCKGTVWFCDINIEVGRKRKSRDWNFAVFMINNTNAKIGNKVISEELSKNQFDTIKTSFEYFKQTIKEFSNNNINATYEIINIDEPLKNISYSEDIGYYVSSNDAYDLINDYLNTHENYDHIFIVTNIGEEINGTIIDWIGLGGMVYNNIGYSNIRISDKTIKSYQTSNSNYFSEEVILHEFLHTLERNSIRLGYETVALHDNEKYGYKNKARIGLRDWYRVYMNKGIVKNVGLDEAVFCTQPISKENFVTRSNVTELLYNNQNILQKVLKNISKIM